MQVHADGHHAGNPRVFQQLRRFSLSVQRSPLSQGWRPRKEFGHRQQLSGSFAQSPVAHLLALAVHLQMARVRPALCSTTSRATSMLRASAYLHQCATSSFPTGETLAGYVITGYYWNLCCKGCMLTGQKNNSIFPGASKVGSVHTLCLGVATVAHVSHLF